MAYDTNQPDKEKASNLTNKDRQKYGKHHILEQKTHIMVRKKSNVIDV
jgi:hypothetical protein